MKLTFLTESGPQVLDAQQGQTLFQVLLTDCAIHMSAPCGGQGTCQKCTVYLQKETGEEAVLACRTLAEDGMVVRLPARETLEVATAENVDPSHILPDPELRGYGIACDIGTTTVVCHLLDLSTGQRLGTCGEGNAQRVLGGDVISRIKAASDGHLEQLQSTIIHQLSCMIQSLCAGAAICPDQISRMSVAANTTMCHLLTGLSPESIGVAPFTPLSLFGNCIDAKSLGLPFSGEVYIAPAISGYVGGDITAGMLAAGLDNAATPVLFIDVGTNGEMVLGCGDHFVCCSTAAGPAFEGAQIRYGMTAAPGAIHAVCHKDGQVSCSVLGNVPATGLCGSGLIDAIAVMLDLGAMDETGRMLDMDDDDIPDHLIPYMTLLDEEPAFLLTNGISVTQSDVRKVQLGKGAIAAGIQVLLKSSQTAYDHISALLLAGGFGSYLSPNSAARIGLIPAELLPVTRAIGNTAAEGAQEILLSSASRTRLAALQQDTAYKELSGMPEFNNAYMEAMMFPEEDP